MNRQEGDDWWILSKHKTYHAAFDALLEELERQENEKCK